MTKETAQQYREVYEGLCAGKTIQTKSKPDWPWRDMVGEIAFDSSPDFYRIKPEPIEFWSPHFGARGLGGSRYETKADCLREYPNATPTLFREVTE